MGQSQHVMSIKRIIVDKAKEVAEEIEARLDTEYKRVIMPRHEDDSPEDAKDTTYGKIKDHKCELCHFKTNNRHNLNRHINHIHNKVKSKSSIYNCKECGKCFNTE